MTKKIICIILSITIISLIPFSSVLADDVQSENLGENITWEIENESTLIINGQGDMTDYTNQKRWWYPSGLNKQINKIIVSDGVTKIGDFTFYDFSNLESITLPDSVTNIGKYAFYNCSFLKNINLPDGVTNIGECAF